MRKVFQAELTSLGEGLITMSHRVASAMEQAWDSFTTQDIALAQDVIAEDARIDFMQNELDERAIDVLALQSPVASDLRMIVGSLRMSASLERMGDLARHIAQLTRLRYPAGVAPHEITPTFTEMARLNIELAHTLGDLLESRNPELAEKIIAANRQIDKLHASVFRLVAFPEWNATPATTADVTLTSRYLERFGDHGVAVTRKVMYLVTGEWEPGSPELPAQEHLTPTAHS